MNDNTPGKAGTDTGTFLRLLRAAVDGAGWTEDPGPLTDEQLSDIVSLLLDSTSATPQDKLAAWIRDAV